jgi:hypothetical protein
LCRPFLWKSPQEVLPLLHAGGGTVPGLRDRSPRALHPEMRYQPEALSLKMNPPGPAFAGPGAKGIPSYGRVISVFPLPTLLTRFSMNVPVVTPFGRRKVASLSFVAGFIDQVITLQARLPR